MEALLDGLNPAQKDAVTSPASVLQVLAPPGSGKTKTLTARVAYLINHERYQPWNIIVCTFTIKAAREMKERIRGMVGDGIEAKLLLGTFHSVAKRFLVKYGQEIGIDRNFGIADTSDSKAIIKRIISRRQYTVEPSIARSRISKLKAKGTSADEFAATTKDVNQHEFANVYSEYEATLKASSLLDYDDLLLRCTDLLQKYPACVSTIQAVLIDEYQDTNNIQYKLMRLMAQATEHITIVGDPDQSIYSFRSAEIKNLHRMREDYPNSVVINLEHNYRSSGCILSSAMAVIEQDGSRPDKPLLPTHCVGEQPTLRHLATANIEAQWIVEEINRSMTLMAGLVSFVDYAILVRSASLSLSIERALGKAGIPYRMVGGTRFFDRSEIKIVLDYLRVINQPNHNDALLRIINTPARKIGPETVKALVEEAEMRQMSLWTLILYYAQGKARPRANISPQAQKGIDAFVNVVLTSRRKLFPAEGEECILLDLIGHVLQKISFEKYLKSTHKDNWRDRWENVEELVAQATQMAVSLLDGEEVADDALPVVEGIEQRQETAADILSKFLANVALSTEVERPAGEEPNQVTISTIHAAKGLEWPIVFIPAVFNGSIPHSRAEDHDEERRLLYVGMTRAQGLLYLSCPLKQSGKDETALSSFISSRSIQKFFSLRGPSFGCSVIQDLAQILRRPLPSGSDIQAARDLLEQIDGEDELWTAPNSNSSGAYPPFKRRRTEPSITATSVKASVTMQDTASFSISTAKMQIGHHGFTSASTHYKIMQEAKAIAQLASVQNAPKKRIHKEKMTEANVVRKKDIKPRPVGQGTITNFFVKSASMLSEESKILPAIPSDPPVRVRTQSSFSTYTPLNDISNAQSNSASNPVPVYKPSAFSSHRPCNIPMVSKPKRLPLEPGNEGQRYVLLSSSPIKPEDDPSKLETLDVGDDEDPSTPRSPAKAMPATMGSSFIGFRPASTFHSTSMGQLQNHAVSQRKTLGMRRSLQGWTVKSHQPPRPRS
ncbi:ATP-depentend DNA helicase-like protein, partial [Lojkania enalia]